MSIITLISDFGYKDYYISALKAKIYKLMPTVKVVDITHDIQKFNFQQGVFVLKNVMYEFPENSVHIFAVAEGGEANDNEYYLVKLGNQYVIGTGTKFISIFDNPNRTIIKLPKVKSNNPFPSFEIFTQVAFQLMRSVAASELGEIQPDIVSQNHSLIDIKQSSIKGTVMHIDDYGNVITNISRTIFDQVRDGRKFEILVARDVLDTICDNYYDVVRGESLCLFNSNNYLEIAISFDNASRLLGIKVDSNVKISFK